MRTLSLIALFLVSTLLGFAADPTDTSYSFAQCDGTSMPYPNRQADAALPDSLTPVFINHVGRHGSRFLASAKDVNILLETLQAADSAKGLTPAGTELLKLAKFVNENSRNRWGALDSLGMAEQRGIASRMIRRYGKFFNNAKVSAISSYSPRCVMSMYEFTHQLDRLNNNMQIYTASGRQNSELLRPFDNDTEFLDWQKSGNWQEPYRMQFQTMMPTAPARKLFTDAYAKNMTTEEAQEITFRMFRLLRGLPSMGLESRTSKYFTQAEANHAWSCINLSHYLQWTETTINPDLTDISAPLLVDLINTLDEAAAGKNQYNVMLRFGHAETLMPLLSLMKLKGCYYLTNYFDTVALHWKDFDIVPMAANLQIVLLRTKAGRLYVRCDLNEQPIPLMPNSAEIYTPWDEAREFLLRNVPLHLRP